MDEARGGFSMNGGVFLLCLFLLMAFVFAFGFVTGYAVHAERTPTAACRCVPPPGLNTGAVIGEVR